MLTLRRMVQHGPMFLDPSNWATKRLHLLGLITMTLPPTKEDMPQLTQEDFVRLVVEAIQDDIEGFEVIDDRIYAHRGGREHTITITTGDTAHWWSATEAARRLIEKARTT
jgi:hypothetical protein